MMKGHHGWAWVLAGVVAWGTFGCQRQADTRPTPGSSERMASAPTLDSSESTNPTQALAERSEPSTVSAPTSEESQSVTGQESHAASVQGEAPQVVVVDYTAFGKPFSQEETPSVSAAEVIARPETYVDRVIRVSGVVESVCAQRGCWIEMKPKEAQEGAKPVTIFVKFTCPVEGRLIPMEAAGREVIVEGKLIIDEMSVEEVQHYAEDAGASPEEIAKITEPEKRLRILAPAAKIAGLPKDDDSRPTEG